MKSTKRPKTDAPSFPKSVKIRYVKSTQFRVFAVDGIYGGLTPQGLINLAFFTERFPLAMEAEYEVSETGSLSKEIQKSPQVAKDIERELEGAAMLRIDTARSLVDWLKNHLAKYDEIQKKQSEGK